MRRHGSIIDGGVTVKRGDGSRVSLCYCIMRTVPTFPKRAFLKQEKTTPRRHKQEGGSQKQ